MFDATFTTANGLLLTAAFTDEAEGIAAAALGVSLAALSRLTPQRLLDRMKRQVRERDGRPVALLYLAVADQVTSGAVEVAPEGGLQFEGTPAGLSLKSALTPPPDTPFSSGDLPTFTAAAT